MKVIFIDCYDSFSWNIIAILKKYVTLDITTYTDVYRSTLNCYNAIVISPGPGTPYDYINLINFIPRNTIPLLGVCLGMEIIAAAEGAELVQLRTPWHGAVSEVLHYHDPIFHGVPVPFKVARYHSWSVKIECNNNLLPIAYSLEDKVIMAIKSNGKLCYGLQFHPESIASDFGEIIICNFLQLVKEKDVYQLSQ